MAAEAGIDMNQQRAKANKTLSPGRSCSTEHRLMAGGGLALTTGGLHTYQKALQRATSAFSPIS
jgi:hypothetical protein